MLGAAFLVLLVVAVLPYVLFTLVYAVRTTWWRSPAGRALMVSTPAVALVLLEEIVFTFLPVPFAVELVVTLVTLLLIAVGGWLKFGALLYELRRGRTDEQR